MSKKKKRIKNRNGKLDYVKAERTRGRQREKAWIQRLINPAASSEAQTTATHITGPLGVLAIKHGSGTRAINKTRIRGDTRSRRHTMNFRIN